MKINTKIANLIWDMACSLSEYRYHNLFYTPEYKKLNDLGWNIYYYEEDNMVSHLTIEEQIMFALMIYYSLTIPD